jgi:pyruvate dehydrogenase (quinone)
MMSMTVSEFVWKRVQEWGLKRVYGYPGDGVGGLDVALEKAQPAMEYVQVRHEEMAAFMASAHAKFTGGVGLCYATSGPGAIHLLNGLYDAKMDNQPVVAIVGQQARSALGTHYQQEVDLVALFKDVASDYVAIGTVPSQVRHLVDRAVRIAQNKRSVTCIILPNDLQLMTYEDPPLVHGSTHTGVGFPAESKVPEMHGLQAAAKVLNEGKRVAMLVGAGCLEATDEVIAVADKLGAGVAKALLGKAAVPDDLSFVTGGLGLLGTKPSWDLMKDCDTLLMVGSAFPYSEFLPKPGSARGVQIDIKGDKLSLRYPMEVNLVGDSVETLKALLPLLEQKTDTKWRDTIKGNIDEWWKILESRAMNSADPINPQRVFWELSPRLPENCIVTADSGSVANWYGRDLKFRRGMKGSLSGYLASLGAATPRGGGEDGLSGARGDRHDRRRRHADERHERDDHRVQILEALVQSAFHPDGVEQPRLEPGDLGGAGAAGRRQNRKHTVDPGFSLRQIRRIAGAQGHLLQRSGEGGRGLG